MNRRKNKVDMEKVFAAVISLAIMIALVVGVTSILNSNKGQGEEKKNNYIDLNEEPGSNYFGANDDETEAPTKNLAERVTEPATKKPVDSAKKTENPSEQATKPKVEPVTEPATQPEPVTEPVTIQEPVTEPVELPSQVAVNNEQPTEVPAQSDVTNPATEVNAPAATILGYSFGPESSLMWPAQGDVIMNYNMTNTIYFPTLDVYKCNPALIISAEVGTMVYAATDGLVSAIYDSEETGLTLEVQIGNDHTLVYGQLKDLVVGVGSQIKRGDVIGAIAEPSSYYTVEGSNLYFQLKNAAGPLNPMDYISE